MKRQAARRDANETEIVRTLRQIGCTVVRTDEIDLIVGYRGRSILLEVKDGEAKREQLTPNQIALKAGWRGQYDIVTSADEAIAVVQRETLR